MNAVLTAMVEDRIGPGEQAKLLVQTAREKIKFEYCIALRSPAIALYMALNTLGLEKGRGVLISALSPLYYVRVIEDLGLVPIYCDVNSSSACMTREKAEKALSSKKEELNVGCVILHHTLGYIGDGYGIAELGLPLIEDCSQCYGTFLEERGEGPVAQPGTAGIYTILGMEERDMLTSGGGALLYSMNRRASRPKETNQPQDSRSQDSKSIDNLPPEFGLPDMNAALAVVQFREAEKDLSKRREIANLYTQAALRTRHKRFILSDSEYNNYAFPLILETGVKDVKAYARRKEISVESAFENTPVACGMAAPEQCPEAYSLSLRTVLFPMYPRLGKADAGKVAKLILTLP